MASHSVWGTEVRYFASLHAMKEDLKYWLVTEVARWNSWGMWIRYLIAFRFWGPFYWLFIFCQLKFFKHFLAHLLTDWSLPMNLNVPEHSAWINPLRMNSVASHWFSDSTQWEVESTAGQRSSQSMWSPLSFTARSPSELKQHLLSFGVRSKSSLCYLFLSHSFWLAYPDLAIDRPDVQVKLTMAR